MKNIQKLESYLKAHSADQKSSHGISIVSTDNPGWWVKIDVRNTPFEHKQFTSVRRGVFVGPAGVESGISAESLTRTTLSDGTVYMTHKNDWIDCEVIEGVFNGAGDSGKLDEIIGIFFAWTENERISQ